jgi:signal peptidase II
LSDKDGSGGRTRRRRLVLVACVAVLVIAADQITKSIAVAKLESGPVHLFGPFSFQLEFNSGVAFSIGVGLTVPIIVAVAAVIAMLVWYARSAPSRTAAVAFGLIIGGALGNVSDRVFRGHGGSVVDFIHSTFWPTFNVADACVVCGSILLALVFAFGRHEPRRVAGDAGPSGLAG